MNKTKNIDFYGDTDNYIHLKFGDARKKYNFTNEFRAKYPDFTKEYIAYFGCEQSRFKNALQIVNYKYNNRIPVNFYYNYIDKLAKSRKEITEYFLREWNMKNL